MKKSAILKVILILLPFAVFAQEDAEGCKDHSLFTRLANFYISGCEQNYNELQLRTSSNSVETKEGNLYTIDYRYNFDSGEKNKSALQIIKNYENAIVKNGGKLLYKNTDFLSADLEASFSFSAKGKEYFVKLYNFGGTASEVELYRLYILEMEAMTQEVDASEIFNALMTKGFIALYINFETGQSKIKDESKPVVNQIAEMLNRNPEIKISIEGHTDKNGTIKSNQTLSENRAKAVMEALVSKGISKNRMSSKGWGQTKPIADNETQEGKAKNRRVEIVKQ